MRFRSYGSYRVSGSEWLGDLPNHWTVERLKRLCDVRPSNVDKKIYEDQGMVYLCNYTDVYYAERITPALELMEATASAEQVERFGLRAGDVIVTKDSETAGDIAISAHVPETMPGVVCGYHLALLRPRAGVEGAFIKRFFDSHFAKSSVAVRANGLTRVGLGQYALDNLLVPTPPEEEQRTIAAFLDRETAKIDALVEEQRRLIELLKEKRQAAISHAVTNGLDPAVPMKNSGVAWLGEVPAAWTVAALKRFVVVQSGYAFPSAGFTADPSGTRLLRGVNIGVGEVKWEDAVYWVRADDDGLGPWELRQGDIVLGMDRPWISDGLRIAQLSEKDVPSLLLQRVAALRPTRELLPTYLHRLLTGEPFYHHCVPDMTGVSVPHISPVQIGDFLVALPPLKEQREIIAKITELEARTSRLSEAATRAILLLQERRAALISAAVTGKIDIREPAAAAAELEPA